MKLDRTCTPDISVVIPVYRSAETVGKLCSALKEALASWRYEVILVNDRSPDNSWAEIQRVALEDKRVVGVNMRINTGQDRAIMAGLNCARGAYVVVMDDDLQHDPRDIPPLYEKVAEGYDVCFANFLKKNQTLIKNAGSYLAGKVAEHVLHKPPEIYMSPFKIVRREVVDEVIKYRGPFPYLDGLLFQITDNVTQITAQHHERYRGTSTHNFWKQAGVFLTLASNFSILPLRVIMVAGLICSGLSLLVGLYFLFGYAFVGISVYRWTALALINVFIGGAILSSLGMVGEYIGRVLLSVNEAPQYVVKETLNTE